MLAARASFSRLGRLAAMAQSTTVLRTSSCLFYQTLPQTVSNFARGLHVHMPLRVSVVAKAPEEKKQGGDVTTTASNSAAAAAESAPSNPLAAVPGATLSQTDKMVILYTCRVCDTRSARTISKPSYQSGVVLVRCPGCNKLHLIADRLGFFGDESADVESLLAARGERVKRSSMGKGFSLAATAAPPDASAIASTPAAPPAPTPSSASPSASDSGDAFVLEFSAEDVAVLRSSNKSINLRTHAEAAVAAAAAASAGTTAAAGKPDSG